MGNTVGSTMGPLDEAPAYPFHVGEQEMHFKTGSWQEAESLGRRMLKPFVADSHAQLLEQLPWLFLASLDSSDRPWAAVMVGHPGFLASTQESPQVVGVRGARLLDAGALSLCPGRWAGCLGILPSSRRRVRFNGKLAEVAKLAGGQLDLVISVDQAYSNCPKYIQKRTLQLDSALLAQVGDASSEASPGGAGALGPSQPPLGPAQLALIQAADTFFIASSSGSPPGSTGASGAQQQHQEPEGHVPAARSAYGCDISHRGGMPGFVQVLDGGRVLKWGDYEGNFMFNTLGNFLVQPACCLLFLDFQGGDMLWVAGLAEVLHKDKELPGAQRAVRLTVESFVHLPGVLPLREVGEVAYSPFNP